MPDSEAFESHLIPSKTLCPNCSANMNRDASAEVMKCPYCGTTIAASAAACLSDNIPRHDLDSSPFFKEPEGQVSAQDEGKANALHCNGCGSTIAYDPKKDVSVCPFCGSTQIMKQSPPACSPDGFLPLNYTKEQAEAEIKKWLATHSDAPDELKNGAYELTLEGAYLPFWIFDGLTKNHYECKQRSTFDHSLILSKSGDLDLPFRDITILALVSRAQYGEKFLGEWSSHEAIRYEPGTEMPLNVLQYDFDLPQAFQEAQQEIIPLIKEAACKQVVGDGVAFSSANSSFQKVTFRLILLPVWIGKLHLGSATYPIVLNGFTGSIDGEYSRILEVLSSNPAYRTPVGQKEYDVPFTKIILGCLIVLVALGRCLVSCNPYVPDHRDMAPSTPVVQSDLSGEAPVKRTKSGALKHKAKKSSSKASSATKY